MGGGHIYGCRPTIGQYLPLNFTIASLTVYVQIIGMFNLSDRRRVILKSGDHVSLWATAVVEDRVCATCPSKLPLTREFNSSFSFYVCV